VESAFLPALDRLGSEVGGSAVEERERALLSLSLSPLTWS
jgi:hypothetical protein